MLGMKMAHRDEATANSFASVWSQADVRKTFSVVSAILTIPEER